MIRSDQVDAVPPGRVPSRGQAHPGANANARIRAAADVIAHALLRSIAMFRQWRQLSRSRRELSTLDEYQLKDIGLTRSQAMFESGKFFMQH